MANRHARSRRKSSGGRYHAHRKSRKYEAGGEFTGTIVGNKEIRKQDGRGNDEKNRVKRITTVSLSNDGETAPAEITAVLENPANPDFVRRNIITKGTIIDTDQGKAKVTSRPGQNGTVNAVLVDDE